MNGIGYRIQFANGSYSDEGPFKTRAEAQRFIDAEVGVPAVVRPQPPKQYALVRKATCSDGSKAYNVELFDSEGRTLAVIGCIDERNAHELAKIVNAQSWTEAAK